MLFLEPKLFFSSGRTFLKGDVLGVFLVFSWSLGLDLNQYIRFFKPAH
jgi:hypothetical protein